MNAYFACFLGTLLWGSAYVAIRAGLHGFTPGAMALLRYGIASAIMAIFYFTKSNRIKLKLSDFISLFILGALGIGLYNLALGLGEITVGAGVAGFILAQVPVCTALFSKWFLAESLNSRGWLGIAISFCGILMITLAESKQMMKLDAGVIYLLGGALLSAAYTVMQKPLLRRLHWIQVASFAIWSGTILLLFFLPDLLRELPKAPTSSTLWIIYNGIFPAAFAYSLWSYALTYLQATRAATFLYTTPFWATVFGWLFLGEPLLSSSLLGGLIALLGAFLVNRYGYDRR